MDSLVASFAKFLERSAGAGVSGFAIWVGVTTLKAAKAFASPYDGYASIGALVLAAIGGIGLALLVGYYVLQEVRGK